MTLKIITSGAAPIVWSTVDEAFDKINSNFQELYATLQANDITALNFESLNSNIIPEENAAYDLGAATKRWRDIFLSNSISLGGAQITSEGLTIDLPSGTTVAGELIKDPTKGFFNTVIVNDDFDIIATPYAQTLKLNAGEAIDIFLDSASEKIIIENSGVTRLTAGTAISISNNVGDVTITNNGVTSLIEGLGISVNTTTGPVTVSNDGIVTIEAGNGITVGARDPNTGKVVITNSLPAGNAYRTFAVSGEVTLTANSAAATVTLIEGSGINITTTPFSGALTDRITFANTGVLSVIAGAGINVSAATGNVTLSVDNRLDIVGSVFADNSTMLVDGTNGRIVGPVFANVTGDVTGNVTGNTNGVHTGTVTGNVTGDVVGNLTGFHTGDSKGSVFADDSTMLVDGTNGSLHGTFDGASVIASSFIQTATYADLTAITSAIPIATKGMIVFDDGTNQFRGYDGSSWVALN